VATLAGAWTPRNRGQYRLMARATNAIGRNAEQGTVEPQWFHVNVIQQVDVKWSNNRCAERKGSSLDRLATLIAGCGNRQTPQGSEGCRRKHKYGKDGRFKARQPVHTIVMPHDEPVFPAVLS